MRCCPSLKSLSLFAVLAAILSIPLSYIYDDYIYPEHGWRVNMLLSRVTNNWIESPPLYTPSVWKRHDFLKPSDVVVSTPSKSGTTWLLNILHQIRTGGDDDFTDVLNDACGWPEFQQYPGQPAQERIASYARQDKHPYRCFKSHSNAFQLGERPVGRKGVKYIVVMRNMVDTFQSMYAFLQRHTPELRRLRGGIPRYYRNARDFFEESSGLFDEAIALLESWWEIRDEEQVLILHFKDFVNDLPGTITRISKHVGVDLDEETHRRVVDHCGFQWMKKHQNKFEMSHYYLTGKNGTFVQGLQSGGMLRKGEKRWNKKFFTEKEIGIMEWHVALNMPSERIRNWVQNGGEFPMDAEWEYREDNEWQEIPEHLRDDYDPARPKKSRKSKARNDDDDEQEVESQAKDQASESE